MSVESVIYDTLKGLVSNRVFPDVAPKDTITPYITYQQVGGAAINFLKQEVPSKMNSRFQINVWSKTRLEAKAIAELASGALRLETQLQTTVIGEGTATYDELTTLRGTRQDFSFWF